MNVHQIAADLRNWLTLHGYIKELPQEHDVALLRVIEGAIEKAYGAGLLDGASEVLNESRAVSEPHPMQPVTNCGRCRDTKFVNGKPCPDCAAPAAHAKELERLYPHTGTADSTGHGQPL